MELLPEYLVDEFAFNVTYDTAPSGDFDKNGNVGNTTGTESSVVVTGDGILNGTEKSSETVNGTAQPNEVVNITGQLGVSANVTEQPTEVVRSSSVTQHPSAAASSTVNRKCNVDFNSLHLLFFCNGIMKNTKCR